MVERDHLEKSFKDTFYQYKLEKEDKYAFLQYTMSNRYFLSVAFRAFCSFQVHRWMLAHRQLTF